MHSAFHFRRGSSILAILVMVVFGITPVFAQDGAEAFDVTRSIIEKIRTSWFFGIVDIGIFVGFIVLVIVLWGVQRRIRRLKIQIASLQRSEDSPEPSQTGLSASQMLLIQEECKQWLRGITVGLTVSAAVLGGIVIWFAQTQLEGAKISLKEDLSKQIGSFTVDLTRKIIQSHAEALQKSEESQSLINRTIKQLNTLQNQAEILRTKIGESNNNLQETISALDKSRSILEGRIQDIANKILSDKKLKDQLIKFFQEQISKTLGNVEKHLAFENGNVGIGAPKPRQTLHVRNNTNTQLTVESPGEKSGIAFRSSTDGYRGFVRFGKFESEINAIPTPGAKSGDSGLAFKIRNDEKMRIDGATGNVGIGTDDPKGKLEVRGHLLISNKSLSTEDLNDRVLLLGPRPSLSTHATLGFQINPEKKAALDYSARFDGLGFRVFDKRWSTPGEYDLFIKRGGNVGIGTTNPTYKLYVDGSIRATGSITSGSSREYKEDIAALSSQQALKTLEGLNPVTFHYKAEKDKDLHLGFIAEDVPDLVATPERKGLSAIDIVAVLTKVVQGQQSKIEALETQLRQLTKKQ